jgi:hypothetical protein
LNIMTKAVWGAGLHLAAVVGLGLASASCGTIAREGTASSFLVVKSFEAASGADPSGFGGTLASDVLTVVESSPTVFNDLGRVQFALALKDPGSPSSPSAPSQANWITVDRYRVRFARTDGRNTEGVDVPYAFDSAVTATVSDDTTVGFTLVRQQAKQEAPLQALGVNGAIVSTIAEVTFYGHDQTGRAVSATANIGVNFANFADPQ